MISSKLKHDIFELLVCQIDYFIALAQESNGRAVDRCLKIADAVRQIRTSLSCYPCQRANNRSQLRDLIWAQFVRQLLAVVHFDFLDRSGVILCVDKQRCVLFTKSFIAIAPTNLVHRNLTTNPSLPLLLANSYTTSHQHVLSEWQCNGSPHRACKRMLGK